MYKIIFVGCLAWLLAVSVVFAEPISLTVTSDGTTKDQAIESAIIKGLEQTFGAFVYSNSRVEMGKIIRENTHILRSGSISKIEVISEKIDESTGTHSVSVRLLVDNQKIQDLLSTYKIRNVKDDFDKLLIINEVQAKKQAQEELFENAFPIGMAFVDKAYIFDIEDYSIDDIHADKINGVVHLRVRTNPIFWQQFKDILSSVSMSASEVDELHKVSLNDYIGYLDGYISDGYPIFFDYGSSGDKVTMVPWPFDKYMGSYGLKAKKCADSFRFKSIYDIPASLNRFLPDISALRMRAKIGENISTDIVNLYLYRNIRLNKKTLDNPDVLRRPRNLYIYSMLDKYGADRKLRNKIRKCDDYVNLTIHKSYDTYPDGSKDAVFTSEDALLIPDDGIVIDIPFSVKNVDDLKKNGIDVEIGWKSDQVIYRAGWPDKNAPIFRSVKVMNRLN